MNDAKKKSYEIAVEAAKQEITLASAILALSATLVKDIFKTPSPVSVGFIVASWIALFMSVTFGTRLLFQLAGALGDVVSNDDEAVRLPTRIPGARRSARAQNAFFLVGLACVLAFGITNLCILMKGLM